MKQAMLSGRRLSFIFLLLFLIFNSCKGYLDIEKRKYCKGFYLHQNIFHSDINYDRDKIIQEQSHESYFTSLDTDLVTPVKNVVLELGVIPKKRPLQCNKMYLGKKNYYGDTIPEQKENSYSLISRKKAIRTADVKKIPSMVIIGFSLSIIGLLATNLSLILGIILYIDLRLSPLGLVFIFGFSLFFASIIILFIGYNKVKKHQDKYKGMGIAVAGLVLSFLGILLSIITFPL